MKTLLRAILFTGLIFVVVMAIAAERNSPKSTPVKQSRSGICHCPGGQHYERTGTFQAFSTIKQCLAAGGRHPKRGQGDCSKATPTPGSPEWVAGTKRPSPPSTTIRRRDLQLGRDQLEDPDAQSVQVIDGDTIRLDGKTIRLKGIDAPELDQMYRDRRGEEQPCGQFARVLLMERLASSVVKCETDKQPDRYGRALGTWYVFEPVDINAWMVSVGLALAYRQYSKAYIAEEDEARADRQGIHQGAFVPPWDWRRGKRLP